MSWLDAFATDIIAGQMAGVYDSLSSWRCRWSWGVPGCILETVHNALPNQWPLDVHLSLSERQPDPCSPWSYSNFASFAASKLRLYLCRSLSLLASFWIHFLFEFSLSARWPLLTHNNKKRSFALLPRRTSRLHSFSTVRFFSSKFSIAVI